MALTPEVILTVISTIFIVVICMVLLNELSDKKLTFKRPKLSLVKEEYMNAIKRR